MGKQVKYPGIAARAQSCAGHAPAVFCVYCLREGCIMMKRFLRGCALLLCLVLITPGYPAAADGESGGGFASALAEASTGMLLDGTDSDRVLPAGSQTKLMTVLLTAEAVAEGRLTEDTPVTAPPSAQEQDGAVIWLTAGEQMTVRDLLKGVIIGNANDAAVTLACRIAGTEQGFTAQMNAEAFSLGMRSTRFCDATGLSAENVTTAADLCLLGCALLRYEWLEPYFTTWRDFLRGDKTELVSENTLIRSDDTLCGFKAGHGADSGYTLCVAASRGGMKLVAAVLGCADAEERFSAGKQLLKSGFASYTVTTPDFSAEFMQPVPVHGGMTGAVTVRTGALRAIAAPKGRELTCTVILPRWLDAPVMSGRQIGAAAFYCGETQLCEIPLLAGETVERRGFSGAAGILLANMFK